MKNQSSQIGTLILERNFKKEMTMPSPKPRVLRKALEKYRAESSKKKTCLCHMSMEQSLDFLSVFHSAFQQTLDKDSMDFKDLLLSGQAVYLHGCVSILKNGFGGKQERKRMMLQESHGFVHPKDQCTTNCSLMTMAKIKLAQMMNRRKEALRSIK